MSQTNFWESRTQQLLDEIKSYLKTHKGPAIAAFDADGTCWFNDVGRDFFLYQCENIFKDQWTWEDYATREKVSVEDSLWWLAEINAQQSKINLLKQAEEALRSPDRPLEIIPSQKILIDFLHSQGVEVYIVTASVKWSVVPAALKLGIDADHVLGVTTLLDEQSLFTPQRFEPITWREGKPKALLQATKNVAPFLCSGNTISDHPLLLSSSQFKISINSVDTKDSIYESEQKLKNISTQSSWLHFDYLDKK